MVSVLVKFFILHVLHSDCAPAAQTTITFHLANSGFRLCSWPGFYSLEFVQTYPIYRWLHARSTPRTSTGTYMTHAGVQRETCIKQDAESIHSHDPSCWTAGLRCFSRVAAL